MKVMGLDNGWIIKSDKRELTRADLPANIRYPFGKDYSNKIEIAYARKWWGVRTDLLNNIEWDDTIDEYYFIIENPEKILNIIELIASWLNKEKWDTEAMSIWTYDEAQPNLIDWIINFSIIYIFMKENPDVYLKFYDSY